MDPGRDTPVWRVHRMCAGRAAILRRGLDTRVFWDEDFTRTGER